MRIVNCEQYSDEWWEVRRGLPTASAFSKIVTPTGKSSTQRIAYMHQLIADIRCDESREFAFTNEWMERGLLMEREARDWLSFELDQPIDEVGMIINESGTLGCSPDGLLSDSGVEIKCPKASTHVGYLLANKLPDKYAAQVHGSIYVSGLDKWVFVSYHPEFDPLVIEVTRDAFTNQVGVYVEKFVNELHIAKRTILGGA